MEYYQLEASVEMVAAGEEQDEEAEEEDEEEEEGVEEKEEEGYLEREEEGVNTCRDNEDESWQHCMTTSTDIMAEDEIPTNKTKFWSRSMSVRSSESAGAASGNIKDLKHYFQVEGFQ